MVIKIKMKNEIKINTTSAYNKDYLSARSRFSYSFWLELKRFLKNQIGFAEDK